MFWYDLCRLALHGLGHTVVFGGEPPERRMKYMKMKTNLKYIRFDLKMVDADKAKPIELCYKCMNVSLHRTVEDTEQDWLFLHRARLACKKELKLQFLFVVDSMQSTYNQGAMDMQRFFHVESIDWKIFSGFTGHFPPMVSLITELIGKGPSLYVLPCYAVSPR